LIPLPSQVSTQEKRAPKRERVKNKKENRTKGDTKVQNNQKRRSLRKAPDIKHISSGLQAKERTREETSEPKDTTEIQLCICVYSIYIQCTSIKIPSVERSNEKGGQRY
jgi:FKBP-type peptidyl-prolyl cis-trans isomerase